MFRTLTDFLDVWESESAATLRVLDALTDESLGQAVTPEDRTLGRIAWHVVGTIHEMMTRAGLSFEAPGDEEDVPTSAREIADGYRRASRALVEAIREQWSDDTLAETRNMYGETWTVGMTLLILLQHQTHHRGQMTVLMRQAGLKVPGVYGPAREEWAEYGMEPPRT